MPMSKLTFFGLAFLLTSHVARAQENCSEQNELFFGRLSGYVSNPKFSGRIAFLPNGVSTVNFRIIHECISLYGDFRELEFVVAHSASLLPHLDNAQNMTPLNSTQRSFLAVQVVKIQSVDQSERLTVSREGRWKLSELNLDPFRDQAPVGLDTQSFYEIHAKNERPSESPVRILGGSRWHAVPEGGQVYSWNWANRFSDPFVTQHINDKRAVFSNRLYTFDPNVVSKNGIRFTIRTSGTQKIFVRTFSPLSSDFDNSIEINLKQ